MEKETKKSTKKEVCKVGIYSDRILDHYSNPRNMGQFRKGTKNVYTGLVGKTSCGDVLKIQLKINNDGLIEDVRFKSFGCGSAIAASSLICEWIKGKTIEQALSIKNTEVAEHLSLLPIKMHCSVLAEEAIHMAVAAFRAKQKGEVFDSVAYAEKHCGHH